MSVVFPGNYYAVFKGYIDVAFLLPVSVAMYLLVDYDFTAFPEIIISSCATLVKR
jgi:hypothetical protein